MYLCACPCGLGAAPCIWFLVLKKNTGKAPLFPRENSGLSKANIRYYYDFAPTISLILFCKNILVVLQTLSDVACCPSPTSPPSHKVLWDWAAIDGGVWCLATNTKMGLGVHSTQPYRTQGKNDIRERERERRIQGDFWVTEAPGPYQFGLMAGQVLVSLQHYEDTQWLLLLWLKLEPRTSSFLHTVLKWHGIYARAVRNSQMFYKCHCHHRDSVSMR